MDSNIRKFGQLPPIPWLYPKLGKVEWIIGQATKAANVKKPIEAYLYIIIIIIWV